MYTYKIVIEYVPFDSLPFNIELMNKFICSEIV